MAKISGRLPNTAPPACAITFETTGGSQPNFALPTPRRMPATGSTETGSISDLPIFCSQPNTRRQRLISLSRASVVQPRYERAHLGAIAGIERLPGGHATMLERQGSDSRLDRRNHGHAHAQLIHAQADEHWHRVRIPRQRSADPDPAVVRVRASD